MSATEEQTVTRAEFARIIGTSKQAVGQQVSRGMYDTCFTPSGKLLYLAKAVNVYNKSLSASQIHKKITLTKEQKIQKKIEKAVKKVKKLQEKVVKEKETPRPSQTYKPSKPAIEVRPTIRMKGGKPVTDDKTTVDEPPEDDYCLEFADEDENEIYNTDNVAELKKLLKKAQSPMHRTQIESNFWQGKTRRLQFLEKEKALIPLAEAKIAIDAIFTPINTQLNNLPVQMKAHYPDVSEDVVKWLMKEIDNIKTDSAKEWGEE